MQVPNIYKSYLSSNAALCYPAAIFINFKFEVNYVKEY